MVLCSRSSLEVEPVESWIHRTISWKGSSPLWTLRCRPRRAAGYAALLSYGNIIACRIAPDKRQRTQRRHSRGRAACCSDDSAGRGCRVPASPTESYQPPIGIARDPGASGWVVVCADLGGRHD
eukprot:5748608-Prymnesium_polylepis.1